MSFLNEDDQAARRSAAPPPPHSREEIESFSRAKAAEWLPGVLVSIKDAYRSHYKGSSHNWQEVGLRTAPRRRQTGEIKIDCKIMVEEMVRLVRAETGLTCTFNSGNHSKGAGFTVTF